MGKFAMVAAMVGLLAPTGCSAGMDENPAKWAVMTRTADMGVVVNGRPIQVEYLTCMFDAEAQWFEDGSAIC